MIFMRTEDSCSGSAVLRVTKLEEKHIQCPLFFPDFFWLVSEYVMSTLFWLDGFYKPSILVEDMS